jgi:hypothetical protein
MHEFHRNYAEVSQELVQEQEKKILRSKQETKTGDSEYYIYYFLFSIYIRKNRRQKKKKQKSHN